MKPIGSSKRERQTKDLLANKPRQHVRAMQRGNVITAAYLNTLGRSCNHVRLGAGIPEQKEFGHETIPVIICDCATYRNVDLGDNNPGSDMFDTYDPVTRNYHLILLNNQDNDAENGIWSFDDRREKPWVREYALFEDTLWQTLVFIRDGFLFAGCMFTWSYENFLRPHFQLPIRVDVASFEDEDLSGIGDLTADTTVSEGDVIFVRNQGVYVVETGDWRQVAEVDVTGPNAASAYNYAAFPSQEVRMLTDEETDDCSPKRYDFSVAPPLLVEAPA